MIKVNLNKNVEITPLKDNIGLMVVEDGKAIKKIDKLTESVSLNTSYYRDLYYIVADHDNLDMKNFKSGKLNVVVIEIHSRALGDQIAWIPIVDLFQKKHNCHVIVRCHFVELFENYYPNLEFRKQYFEGDTIEDIEEVIADAVYVLGYAVNGYTNKDGLKVSPKDCRTLSLQEVACAQLGIEYKETRPKFERDTEPLIKGKYICITTAAAGDFKFWHYPNGWQELTNYFAFRGYKVVHIGDTPFKLKNTIRKTGKLQWNSLMNYIQHAEFFVGLPSGLTVLSWGLGQTSYVIDGITKDFGYMQENVIKIQNKNVCNGCFNDSNFVYDGQPNYCPQDKNFECTKRITTGMVIEKIGI